MPEQNSANLARPGSAVVGTVFGALIGACFGRLWLSLAASALPEGRAAIEIAGWGVLAAFAIAGVLAARSARRAPPTQSGGQRPRSGSAIWFALLIALEIALIFGGQSLLGRTLGHPEWIPAWALFVVGAHFWPFALILRVDAFRILAGALCAVAVISAVVAAVAGIASLWSLLPGLGGAAVLWGFCGWTLYRMVRPSAR